jgi:C-terminal processing protease CtpA/Prc
VSRPIKAPAWLILVLLALAAAPARAQSDCSILGQNTFVRDTLLQYYLWYRELPDLAPALFDSPEAYLDAVRYRPRDRNFSYIAPRAATEAYYSDSKFIGIGLSFKQTRPDEIRVSQVFPDSPASQARMARGDYLLTVDGRPVVDLLLTGEFSAAFGADEVGVRVELEWKTRRGELRSAVVTKREVTIPTVSHTGVFDLDGLPVGYLHFRNFVGPSVDALDRAFAEFRARGVTDLILDLRYNGGGLVSVAQHLAGLIGGVKTNAKVFVRYLHNDKNTNLNKAIAFENPAEALDLQRLVVITTRSSASASELVVNGLRPFIPVTLIGDDTFGKPVGQYGFEFCDKVFFPVAFQGVNALGQGDYFNGFPADCPAADNLDRPQGNPEESSLEEALYFLRTGACSARSEALKTALAQRLFDPRMLTHTAWRQLVNAW